MIPQQDFTLPTPDGKTIYGIWDRANESLSDKVVVIAHGLTGWACEHQHMFARRYLTQRGYDVVRFNFYAGADDARKLRDITVQIQADDLNLVCDHFRPQYKKLFVIGHSYGGLTLLFANPVATALSFWDASFTPYESFWKDTASRLSGTPYYIHGWGSYHLIGEAMIEEAKNLSEADSIALARRIAMPSQVILAGLCSENLVRTALYDSLVCEKEMQDIEGADHTFSRDDTVQVLLEKTESWFARH